MDTNTFNLDEFKFIDEADLITRFGSALREFFASFLGMTPVWPPLIFEGYRGWITTPSLSVLGAAVGFDDPASVRLLTFHNKRLRLRAIVLLLAYIILCVPIIIFGAILIIPIIDFFSDPNNIFILKGLPTFLSKFIVSLTLILIYIPLLMLFGIALKVAAIIGDKYFADSLCVMTIVYLIIELSREDTLTLPSRRVEVLKRMNHLSRNTLLLSLRYASHNMNNQDWIQKHFKNMEAYIRERERWAIAPIETTLSMLRNDLYQLAPIYLSGNYGIYSWVDVATTPELQLTRKQRFRAALPRLVGFLIPLLITGFFILRPDQSAALGISINVVSLIFISWLLLAIDSVLKLGVVAGFVNLAKGIKELK